MLNGSLDQRHPKYVPRASPTELAVRLATQFTAGVVPGLRLSLELTNEDDYTDLSTATCSKIDQECHVVWIQQQTAHTKAY